MIIDLPQAVDAAGNNHAEEMLERDVNNLRDYFGRFAPELLTTQYAKEIWDLFSHGNLTVETILTGRFKESTKAVDLKTVMRGRGRSTKRSAFALATRSRTTQIFTR